MEGIKMINYHNIQELLGDVSILFDQLEILNESFKTTMEIYNEIGLTKEKLRDNYLLMDHDVKRMAHIEEICQRYIFGKNNMPEEIPKTL
jgi:hypothetical protein